MLGTEELIEQRKHGEQRREQGGGQGGKLNETREEMGGDGRGVGDNVYKRINSSLGGNVFNTFIPYYEMYNIRVS